MIPQEAIEAAEQAIRKEMESQTYDRHTYTRIALEAAAPFLRAQALVDAASEMTRLWSIGKKPYAECSKGELADYNPYVHMKPEEWLRARAATERG